MRLKLREWNDTREKNEIICSCDSFFTNLVISTNGFQIDNYFYLHPSLSSEYWDMLLLSCITTCVSVIIQLRPIDRTARRNMFNFLYQPVIREGIDTHQIAHHRTLHIYLKPIILVCSILLDLAIFNHSIWSNQTRRVHL